MNAIGIIQEQHGERTELFNKWKRMKHMKLVFDSLNRLDVAAVPIVLLIDEHGVIRKRNPMPSDVGEFLNRDFQPPAGSELVKIPSRPGDAAALDGNYDAAIKQYRSHLMANPNDARTIFRMGVCFRKRFDAVSNGSIRDAADFARAVEQWQKALALNPNQYIWRRRLQQYGPILSKPYPFYDWVAQAKADIVGRGEVPPELSAEPAGAELVGPKSSKQKDKSVPAVEPDPSGNLERDSNGAIAIQSAIVHSTERKMTARIHLLLRPSGLTDYVWNNEVEPVQIWLAPSGGISVSEPLIEIIPAPEAANRPTSEELRSTEFEVSWKTTQRTNLRVLTGYVVYHLCNKSNGSCVCLRQDFSIDVSPSK